MLCNILVLKNDALITYFEEIGTFFLFNPPDARFRQSSDLFVARVDHLLRLQRPASAYKLKSTQ
jgi:hypothetical protein